MCVCEGVGCRSPLRLVGNPEEWASGASTEHLTGLNLTRSI